MFQWPAWLTPNSLLTFIPAMVAATGALMVGIGTLFNIRILPLGDGVRQARATERAIVSLKARLDQVTTERNTLRTQLHTRKRQSSIPTASTPTPPTRRQRPPTVAATSVKKRRSKATKAKRRKRR